MPIFLDDKTYEALLADLRTAALKDDWRGAMAEALACADVLPARCRDDFDLPSIQTNRSVCTEIFHIA